MGRIQTRRIRRLLRAHALASMKAADTGARSRSTLAPDSPRAIARRMAAEGVALLAQAGVPVVPTLPVTQQGDDSPLSRPRRGPFAGPRPGRPV